MTTQATVLVDVEGCVLQWDAGAEALFGYAGDQALGERVDFMIPEEHRGAHWAGFHRAMAAPELKDMTADMPVVCADGTTRHFAGRLLALSDGLGEAVGALAVFTDAGATGIRPFG